MSQVHEYQCHLEWSGSTAVGYEHYDRTHHVSCPPADTALRMSSDPAFLGDPAALNPEQLLLAAASSCQMLSFIAVAARSRIEVISYVDEAHAIMPEDDKPVRITQITLRPHIVVATGASESRVQRCIELAHEQCFIANSVKSAMTIEPRIEYVSAPSSPV